MFSDEVKLGCETAINCVVSNGNTTTTVTTPPTTTGGTILRRESSGNTTSTSQFGSTGQAGDGIYNQALSAKGTATGVMTAAYGLAGSLARSCGPHNPTPCILAPIAALAGAAAGATAGDAQGLMNSLGTSSPVDAAGSTTGGTFDDPLNTAKTLDKIKSDLAKQGYIMNSDGSTTLPNGKTIAADLNSDSLKKAGLTDSQIAQLNKDVLKLKKDIGQGSGTGKQDLNAANDYGGERTALEGGRSISSIASPADRTQVDANAWSGFFTQFGDSKIGVPQSDIFLMVEKRVDNERKAMEH